VVVEVVDGMAPGDEAPPGTPGSGEDVCPKCNSSGEVTDHLDDLRRRLAERTTHDARDDRVTADRLAAMRRRLGELERRSENSTDAVAVMAAEEEALGIMDSLENVRDLRSPQGPLS
jgi:hypothetical protein